MFIDNGSVSFTYRFTGFRIIKGISYRRVGKVIGTEEGGKFFNENL